MDWKLVAQLGGGVFVATLLIVYGTKFLKWLIPFLIDRSMGPVLELVKEFKEAVSTQMTNLTEDHKAILTREEEQIKLLREMNNRS